ncbi:MAG: zinc-ribbon domain-containing protein [Candidatus Bathyarchaeales archaeon]
MRVQLYCPKCGSQVDETMAFCPKCGAPLKATAATAQPAQAPQRAEKAEKQEKGEKQEKQEPEKGEKHEKGEYGFVGWLIGGVILILLGLFALLQIAGYVPPRLGWAVVLLAAGILIIVSAVYFSLRARKRFPPPTS